MQEIYQHLKKQYPEIFGNLAFDGRKNLYSSFHIPFEGDRQEYQVQLSPQGKVYRVRFTKTHQEIIPEYVTRLHQVARSSKLICSS